MKERRKGGKVGVRGKEVKEAEKKIILIVNPFSLQRFFFNYLNAPF
jgi:hypothetical protein